MNWRKKMRKWIARKLFDLAVRLDWDEVAMAAQVVAVIDAQLKAAFAEPKKKMGRPKGAKDRVARKVPTPPKKIGRPLGSKNKPKVQP
jgi:hypothetical protein